MIYNLYIPTAHSIWYDFTIKEKRMVVRQYICSSSSARPISMTPNLHLNVKKPGTCTSLFAAGGRADAMSILQRTWHRPKSNAGRDAAVVRYYPTVVARLTDHHTMHVVVRLFDSQNIILDQPSAAVSHTVLAYLSTSTSGRLTKSSGFSDETRCS